MFVERRPRDVARLSNRPNNRRHDCRRGTQECARHNGFNSLTGCRELSDIAFSRWLPEGAVPGQGFGKRHFYDLTLTCGTLYIA